MIGLHALFAQNGTWAPAVQSMSTVVLAAITGGYTYLTFRLVRPSGRLRVCGLGRRAPGDLSRFIARNDEAMWNASALPGGHRSAQPDLLKPLDGRHAMRTLRNGMLERTGLVPRPRRGKCSAPRSALVGQTHLTSTMLARADLTKVVVGSAVAKMLSMCATPNSRSLGGRHGRRRPLLEAPPGCFHGAGTVQQHCQQRTIYPLAPIEGSEQSSALFDVPSTDVGFGLDAYPRLRGKHRTADAAGNATTQKMRTRRLTTFRIGGRPPPFSGMTVRPMRSPRTPSTSSAIGWCFPRDRVLSAFIRHEYTG